MRIQSARHIHCIDLDGSKECLHGFVFEHPGLLGTAMEQPWNSITYGPLFANKAFVTNLWIRQVAHCTCHKDNMTTARSPGPWQTMGKSSSRSNSVMVICPWPSASILPWSRIPGPFAFDSTTLCHHRSSMFHFPTLRCTSLFHI